MKKIIGRQGVCGKQNRGVIRESFTGKNLTCYGGTGKIRRFFGRHGLIQELERTLKVEGRRESVYSPGQMVLSMLYGLFLGHSRPNQMCGALGLDRVFQKLAGVVGVSGSGQAQHRLLHGGRRGLTAAQLSVFRVQESPVLPWS